MSGVTFLDTPDRGGRSGTLRAGGTDLQERLRTRRATPEILDLTGLPGFAGVERSDTGARIGAGTTIAAVARELADGYPALAISAGGLATPQVRAVGTIGGNLLQHTRCWYARHPETSCFKNGGDSCPARTGRHLYGVVFDRSTCVHPHPSTLAMALLTYDAAVELGDGSSMSVTDLLGDGSDPTRDHLLPGDAILTAIALPAPWESEHAAYFRSISRFEAEWPLVEAVLRVRLADDGSVAAAGLGLGGVATVPLRMTSAEDLLVGRALDDVAISEVSEACAAGANPLPETGYKVDLVVATVREVLERVAAGAG